jgi:hypothetical protein
MQLVSARQALEEVDTTLGLVLGLGTREVLVVLLQQV